MPEHHSPVMLSQVQLKKALAYCCGIVYTVTHKTSLLFVILLVVGTNSIYHFRCVVLYFLCIFTVLLIYSKELMKLRGWTDYRLAKEANLSHSTVTNMFNRNNAPTLPTLEAVCKAFGITLAQFFADEVDSAQLTDEQRTLFAKWSSLTERQKSLLLDLMETM